VLRERGELQELIVLGPTALALEVIVKENHALPAEFTFDGRTARSIIRRSEFLDLLAERPSREAALRTCLPGNRDQAIDYRFEIDLFTQKRKPDAV